VRSFACYKQKCKLAPFNLAHPAEYESLRPKTPWLPGGKELMTLRSISECDVTNGQTDTPPVAKSLYSVAERNKNCKQILGDVGKVWRAEKISRFQGHDILQRQITRNDTRQNFT